ncbi:hypothetical protein JSO62_02575 [Riemerella anatipestifer]
MRINTLFLIIITVLFVGCKTNTVSNTRISDEIDFSFTNKTEIIKTEKNRKSKDISLGYFWGVDENIYPMFEKYSFQDPKSYERPKNEFLLKVDYFFTKSEELKCKLYEWNINYDSKNQSKSLQKKFGEIKEFVTTKIGKPSFENYEDLSTSTEQTVRDDVKWTSENLGAYLFRFKGKGGFDQIRLSIYEK